MSDRIQRMLPLSYRRDPVSVRMSLSGMVVRAHVMTGTSAGLASLLAAADVEFDSDSFADAIFSVSQVRKVCDIAELSVTCDRHLDPLWNLVSEPPVASSPAAVSADPQSQLWLSWLDGDGSVHEYGVSHDIGRMLMASQIPFSASSRAWELMNEAGTLPVVIGRARVNVDRFVDIATTIPQAAESAPIRGLFRQNDTTLGCAAAFAADIAAAPGFLWVGPLPRQPAVPSFTGLVAEVSPARWSDIATIVSLLSLHGAVVVQGKRGSGRRFTALSALTTADSLPVVVVCATTRLWLWSRHADRLGLTWSLCDQRPADIYLYPYDAVTPSTRFPRAGSVLFDSVEEIVGSSGGTGDRLSGLHHLIDIPKVAVCERWPDALDDQVALMSVVRPYEFAPEVPALSRYCGDAVANARHHIDLYRMTVTATDATATGSDKVVVVDLDQDTLALLDNERELATHRSDERQDEVECDIVDVGSATAMSAKLTTAAQLARHSAQCGASVAVVVRNARARTIMRALCRPHHLSATAAPGSVTVVTEVRDLADFDVVVVTVWPSSFTEFSAALRPDGAQDVIVVSTRVDIDADRAWRAAGNG